MLRHEFAWSYSRYKLFNSCKLAYFFHYYASWGGWDQYSDQRSRQIYLLKNLKNSDSWIEEIFRNSLIEDFHNGEYYFRKLERNAFGKLNRDICDIRNSSWKDDPKKINLFEQYYNSKSLPGIESDAKRKLSNIFANFANHMSVVEDISYLHINHFKRPDSFRLDGIRVWCSPDFIYQDKGRTVIIELSFKDPTSSSDWAFKAAVDAIFAQLTWRGRAAESKTVFLHKKNFPTLNILRNQKEVRSIIKSSSAEMLELTDLDTNMQEENFLPTANRDKCESCVYKEICRR